MPDTLTPDELRAIREGTNRQHRNPWETIDALLAHIDALTAAVEGLPGYSDNLYGKEKSWVDVADVLAVMEGKPRELDLTDPVVREAQVYGGDDRARQVADWTDPKG